MKSLTPLFALISLTLSASAFAAADCKNESNYPLISTAELQKVAQAKTATIFDVNSAESFQEAQVPGAIHFGSHKKDFAKNLPSDKSALVVAYCGGPQCTAWLSAAKEACALGYTNVKHYKEGISGWKKANL